MRAVGAALAALLVGACQQDVASIRPTTAVASGPAAAASAAVVPARCPPTGTTIRTSLGTDIIYLGRDPGDPELCLLRNGSGRPVVAGIHGLWAAGSDTEQFHRAGLRRLVPFAVGNETSYQSQGTVGAWRNTWRILAQEAITVPAGRFDVWVVERIQEGVVGNTHRSEQILYIDRNTGAVVKTLSRTVRGTGGPGPSWEALSVRSS